MAELFARFPDAGRQAARARRARLRGGQRQILAMAMALMAAPTLLLLDEPSAGLPPARGRGAVRHDRCAEPRGVAIVMVEQNALEALAVAGRGYVLVEGRAEREGRRPTWPPIRRCAISFSAARLRLCSQVERGNGGLSHEHDLASAAAPRWPAVSPPLASPPCCGPDRSDQARHPDAAHRRRRLLRAVMAKVAAAVVEEVNTAGGVLGRKIECW